MDLERYGIAHKLPRLTKLADEVSGLESRHKEAQQRHAQLQRDLQQARELDLNAEAEAVKSGGRRPPRKAPDLEAKLLAAEHDAEVLRRAHSMASQDYSRYVSEHRDEIRGVYLTALRERARELAGHAQGALAAYAELADAKYDLKAVAPLPEPEPEMPADWRGNPVSNVYLNFGPGVAQPAGPDRGAVEGALRYLASAPGWFGEPEGEAGEAEGAA